jgi:hypothetical protein
MALFYFLLFAFAMDHTLQFAANQTNINRKMSLAWHRRDWAQLDCAMRSSAFQSMLMAS